MRKIFYIWTANNAWWISETNPRPWHPRVKFYLLMDGKFHNNETDMIDFWKFEETNTIGKSKKYINSKRLAIAVAKKYYPGCRINHTRD
jgi:hypothetical protein